ncbi:unnamed protein product, partial [Notodromas monacha]
MPTQYSMDTAEVLAGLADGDSRRATQFGIGGSTQETRESNRPVREVRASSNIVINRESLPSSSGVGLSARERLKQRIESMPEEEIQILLHLYETDVKRR